MVYPDSFCEEPSSLRLTKLMIAGSSLWWRYTIKMENHPLPPFPYHQPINIASIAYWHRFQNTVSRTQYSNNKLRRAINLALCWVRTRTLAAEVTNLTEAQLIWLFGWVTINIYWFPWIIPSPISPLVQSCSHLHKIYVRDILVWLLVAPHQTWKWDIPLVLFGFKLQQQP